MVSSDAFISVIAPLSNAASIVDSFIADVSSVLSASYAHWELVLIDDGSTDDTAERVRRHLSSSAGLRLIRLSRHVGTEIAVSAGLDSAIGDFVVVMLPNSSPPALIPAMVEIARGETGIVFGCRASRSADSVLVRAGAAAFRWYCRSVLRLALPARATHYCVLARRVVNALTRDRRRLRDLRLLGLLTGFATRTLSFEEIDRGAGPNKRRFWHQLNLALAIMVQSSRHPLRFAAGLGVLAALANAAWALVVVTGWVRGVESSQSVLQLQLALSFASLLSIAAIIAEYVGQLMAESDGRPLYYVMDEAQGSASILDDQLRNVVSESDRPGRTS
jgi:glycosyltransferase involved in cell wall biosynthesis